MSTLIKETDTERMYWFKEEDMWFEGIRYVHVRTYTLTDRWRRTGDQWYKLEPIVSKEEPYWEVSFDYRPEKVSP